MRFKYFLLLLVLVGACKTTRVPQATVPEVTEWISDESLRKPLRDKEIYAATVESVPLDNAYITGDTLHLDTKKMQACAATDFELIWNGAMLKSLPPQTSVKLFQRAEPTCKEQHWFHLTYDISPLRMKQGAASDSAGSRPSTIIRIWGWKPSLKYEY